MTHATYDPPNTVYVDQDTAKFIAEAESWAVEAANKQEETRSKKVLQNLFELGALDAIRSTLNTGLSDNSDAYFTGFDYGQKLMRAITKEVVVRYPSVSDEEIAHRYGRHSLETITVVEKIE